MVSDGHIQVLVHPIGYVDLIADVAPHNWLNGKLGSFPTFMVLHAGGTCEFSHTCSTINCSIHNMKPNLFARMDISFEPSPDGSSLGTKFGFL